MHAYTIYYDYEEKSLLFMYNSDVHLPLCPVQFTVLLLCMHIATCLLLEPFLVADSENK